MTIALADRVNVSPPSEPGASSGGRFWALLPVVLLGSMVLGLSTIVVLFVNDPSVSLEDDYYRKAVNWDRHQADALQSRQLGYRVTLTTRVSPDGRTFRVNVAAADRTGVPLSGAQINLDAFPNARAGTTVHKTLNERVPGIYSIELPRVLSGLWEFRLEISRGQRGQAGQQRYLEVFRRDVGASSP